MRKIMAGLFVILMSLPAIAKFSYEGYLTDTTGAPLASTPVTIKLEIKTITGACLIYGETQSVTTDAEGYFSVIVGSGTSTGTYTTLAFDDLFVNGVAIAATNPSCNTTPPAGEARNLYVSVSTDSGATYDSLGSLPIFPVAVATNADKVGKHTPASLVRVETAGVPAAAPILSVADATELPLLLAGTSTKYIQTAAGGAAALPTTAGSTAGSMWYDSATKTVKFFDGSGAVALGFSGSGGGSAGITSFNGDVYSTGSSGAVSATISNQAVTYSKMQSMTANTILGRLGSAGTPQEITIGSGFNVAGAVLNVSASGTLASLPCSNGQVPFYTGSNWVCQATSYGGAVSTLVMTDGVGNISTNTLEGFMAKIKGSTSGMVSLYAPTVVTNYDLILPGGQGTAGQVMMNNGSGQMVWSSLPVVDFQANGSLPMTGAFQAIGGSASAPAINFGGNSATGIYGPGGSAVAIATGGVDRMKIDSAGVVGIFGGKLVVDSYGGTGFQSMIFGRSGRGSVGAPMATVSGDILAQFGGIGHNGTTFIGSPSAHISYVAEESFTGTNKGAGISFDTTAVGASMTSSSKMYINSTGNVGIGTVTPGFKLDVVGSINSTVGLNISGTSICTSSGCTSVSDVRYKENISPLQSSLDKILKMQGVEYDWIDKSRFGHQHQIGFIAQEVEKIYPEIVRTDEKTGYKSVMYDKLVAPLVESVKELYQKYLSQDQEIARLKQENAAIKAYLCAKDVSAPLCQ